jgi:hypothetical protein
LASAPIEQAESEVERAFCCGERSLIPVYSYPENVRRSTATRAGRLVGGTRVTYREDSDVPQTPRARGEKDLSGVGWRSFAWPTASPLTTQTMDLHNAIKETNKPTRRDES